MKGMNSLMKYGTHYADRITFIYSESDAVQQLKYKRPDALDYGLCAISWALAWTEENTWTRRLYGTISIVLRWDTYEKMTWGGASDWFQAMAYARDEKGPPFSSLA
jgi:hypothetical protein